MPFIIQSVHSKLLLTRSLAQVVLQHPRAHNEHQVWEIIPNKDGTILIKEKSTHTYLTAPGKEQQQVTVAPLDPDNNFQKWLQQKDDGNSCLILCCYNRNNCLDVAEPSDEENAPVVESHIRAGHNGTEKKQRWVITPV